MTRRLFALLLCICMIGSMTVYAADDVTEPSVPESSAPASEPTVPETSVHASEPTVPETSAPASEPTVPESSAPAADPTEPSQADVPAGPAVGDTIYIKSRSLTYKAPDENSEKREVVSNYKTKIVAIVTDELGNAAWYEFEPTGLLQWFKDYKFVKVENTTVTDPEEPDVTDPTVPETPDSSDSVTTDDGNTVAVDGIPASMELVVEEPNAKDLRVADEAAEDHFDSLRSSRTPNKRRDLFSYDISVQDAENNVWQPDGTKVDVELKIPDLHLNTYEKVYIAHNHNGTVEILEAKVDTSNGTVSFETDGFSTFYGFIVDFEYNGLKFSIDGGSEVQLSEIFKELKINRSVSQVKSVVFSDDSLIEITAKDGDYVLKSLKSFGTDEWLVVTFKDGTTIEIKVTDPVLFYYLDGTDWCMDTFSGTITRKDNKNGAEAPAGDVVINTEAITGAALGKTHGAGTADVIIYARPGMAIRVDRYSDFSNLNKETTYKDSNNNDYIIPKQLENNVSLDGLWRWVWGKDNGAGSDTTGYNYIVIADDITEVKETSFQVRIGDHGVENSTTYIPCEIKIVIVPEWEEPTLLRDAIAANTNLNEKYEIREVPVTLFNYDGKAFNEYYNNAYSANNKDKFFAFSGYSLGVSADKDLSPAKPWSTEGQVNGGGSFAIMGIVQNQLSEAGLPVISAGQNVDLFSKNTSAFKTYDDVDFEFVYEKGTGYYTYSSNLNHAQKNGNKIELYRQAMGTTANYALHGGSPNYAAGGFYPHSDIHQAAGNSGRVLDWDTWEARLETGYIKEPAPYGRDLVLSTAANTTVDMHNGLSLDAKFYMPADKKAADGQDMIYEFTGDDDLWVFVDGELVLDIGGGHLPVSGQINFTQGTVTIWNDTVSDPEIKQYAYYTVAFDENNECTQTLHETQFLKDDLDFAGDTTHRLQIFYLERHSGVSNCRMRFNLPLVPDGAALVTKNVLNDEGEDAFAIDTDEEYTFVMYTADDDDDVVGDVQGYAPRVNAPYTIIGGDGTVLRTDANTGEFKLKAGQTAQFEGIARFTEVYVVEKDPTGTYQYSKVNVDGKEIDYTAGRDPYAKSATKIIPDKDTIEFTFTNYMEVSDLTISKTLIDEYDVVAADTQYEVTVNIADVPYTGKAKLNGKETDIVDGNILLKDTDVLVIENIPTNVTYSVVETDPETTPGAPETGTNTKSGYKYLDPTYKVDDANAATTAPNAILDADTAVVITNELEKLFGNLTISKSGIDALDKHAANGDNKAETQSNLFTVVGTSYSGEEINMEVVIDGNGSVTIMHLPVGIYTVKEKTDWSWSYDLVGANARDVEVEAEKTAATAFENSRTTTYWLSGDSICSNWWGGANGAVVKRG